MTNPGNGRSRLAPRWRAAVEIAFIVFLFYANLLMGEFTAAKRPRPSLAAALRNIVTLETLAIAIVAASIGYGVVEYLRKRL